jgi:hypothetical protein
MQFGNGEQEHDYKEALTGAINAAQAQVAANAVTKVLGAITGFAAATFLIPFVAVYAWNGLTPEGFHDLSYLPTVAGFFVGRIVLKWVKSNG